eukprot:TRINITY_DN11411_c0_g1_i1.p3 TRINITY_DN11411_c0_g1~~TRINITY_DN11411_c0_g1_i1.p3  ORF type:complete len:104 (+),score=13.88 TRINITY_DN11411_c0_g1_i1:192-503(+)
MGTSNDDIARAVAELSSVLAKYTIGVEDWKLGRAIEIDAHETLRRQQEICGAGSDEQPGREAYAESEGSEEVAAPRTPPTFIQSAMPPPLVPTAPKLQLHIVI